VLRTILRANDFDNLILYVAVKLPLQKLV